MSTAALTPSIDPQTSPSEERAGKYLIFRLGTGEFGARVIRIREIMGIQDITPVPQMPEFIRGVINLRGKVIPVTDLRLKFGLVPEACTPLTCIIVVRVQSAERSSEDLLMGVIVDEVAEVLNLAETDIEDIPDFGNGVRARYLLGMAKIKDRVKILLDIDEVLHTGACQELSDLAS